MTQTLGSNPSTHAELSAWLDLSAAFDGSFTDLEGSVFGLTRSFSVLVTGVLGGSGSGGIGSAWALVSVGVGAGVGADSGVAGTNSSLPGLKASVGLTAEVLLEDIETVGGGGGGGTGATASVVVAGLAPAR